MGLERPDLVATLAAALPDGVLRTGRRCTAFIQDARSAQLTFDDGTKVEADVVVGADGINSAVLRSTPVS
jgi:salicylate hydroxylase